MLQTSNALDNQEDDEGKKDCKAGENRKEKASIEGLCSELKGMNRVEKKAACKVPQEALDGKSGEDVCKTCGKCNPPALLQTSNTSSALDNQEEVIAEAMLQTSNALDNQENDEGKKDCKAGENRKEKASIEGLCSELKGMNRVEKKAA